MKTLCSVSRASQKCGDPFLLLYVQICASLCNTCCFKKSQCMFGKTNSNAKSRCDRGKSVPPACGLGNQTFSALPHFLAQLLFGSYWWKVSAIHGKQRPFNWANGANYKGNVVKISFLNWMLPAIKTVWGLRGGKLCENIADGNCYRPLTQDVSTNKHLKFFKYIYTEK